MDAQLALELFGGDPRSGCSSLGTWRGTRAAARSMSGEDRPGGRVDVVPAGGAGPRLPPLLGLVAAEDALTVAAGAVGVLAVRRVAGAPEKSRQAVSSGKSVRNSVTE